MMQIRYTNKLGSLAFGTECLVKLTCSQVVPILLARSRLSVELRLRYFHNRSPSRMLRWGLARDRYSVCTSLKQATGDGVNTGHWGVGHEGGANAKPNRADDHISLPTEGVV